MNSSQNAIEVKDVKKSFKVYYDRGITFKDKILSRGRSRYETREVLKGISFNVKCGEAIGLIGKNGCGKSTTLKLLTKIIYPNEGSIELNGRVSSLLELGAGFHPDMSGRENIYMNAAVFGLNRGEIDKRVDSIIQFSELEEFIDNPVRTYSSGMYMRLAFSVAINVDADILLVDEILAVGDISFQKKCFEKLNEIKGKGTTIVIVSHSLDQIEKICDRTIWIENGLIKEDGRPRIVHEHYLYSMEKERLEAFQENYYANIDENLHEEQRIEQINNSFQEDTLKEESSSQLTESHEILVETKHFSYNFLNNNNLLHQGNGKLCFTEMFLVGANGEEQVVFETGNDIVVYLRYRTQEENLRGTICLLIYRDDDIYCYGTNSYIEKREILDLVENGYAKITLKNVPLLPGKYYFTIAVHDEKAIEMERVERVACIQVFSAKEDQGIVRIENEWLV